MRQGRRSAVIAAAISVAVASSGALAAPARSLTVQYTGPGSTPAATFAVGGQGSTAGGIEIPLRRHERLLMLAGTDTSGLPTRYDVTQLLDAEKGVYVEVGSVCGITAHAMRLVDPVAPVVIFPEAGTCGDLPSMPAKGTIRVTLR